MNFEKVSDGMEWNAFAKLLMVVDGFCYCVFQFYGYGKINFRSKLLKSIQFILFYDEIVKYKMGRDGGVYVKLLLLLKRFSFFQT